eukprot:12279062-Karenia_brevis.AAC.1
MPQAGALMAFFIGALWPGERMDPQDQMYKCPFAKWQDMVRFTSSIHVLSSSPTGIQWSVRHGT